MSNRITERLFCQTHVIRCLSWLIDMYCIENSVFQDRITVRKEYVHFTGKWYGNSKDMKGAIIQSSKSVIWKFLFFIFPKCSYNFIVENMFERITIKEYDYTPIEVQLCRNKGSGSTNKMMYYRKYGDGRFWTCITSREQCFIKRSESWSVTHCLGMLS